MKKTTRIIVFMLTMLLLTACGASAKVETNTVAVDKKGVVTSTLVEEFAESYYDADELKKMVDKEVADYNATAGADSVTVDTFEVSEGKATLVRKFGTYKDYAALNDTEFFIGTVADAYDAGYEFDSVVSADGDTTLSKQQILENGDSRIVICEQAQDVRVPGKITYISSGVKIKDNKTATVTEEGSLAYILYQ